MSAERLFQMVNLLLEHDRLTADQLAEQLGVSVRTIYRDVDVLSAAGVPVCTTQGKGGGVFLSDGRLLERAAFTPEEQRLLLDAVRSLSQGGEEDALARLSALFRLEEEDWLQVALTRWGDTGLDDRNFQLLREAIHRRRAVEFHYASSRGEQRLHRVLPARLLFRGRTWYLQAWCPEREQYRDFRLTRMLELALTGQPFHRRLTPPAPDPQGEIPPMFRVECTLRFAPSLAHRVTDEFHRSLITPLENGGLEVHAVFPEDPRLCGYLLSFGPGLEVVEPPTLRQKLADLARAVCRTYDTAADT